MFERSFKSSGEPAMGVRTKERIVEASAQLFRRQGFVGTGMKQIAEMAEAQFGSLYHFFPGGKEELGAEVVRWAGKLYEQLVVGFMLAAPDPAAGVRNVFAGAAETLRQTDFADACPIETVALEVASTNEPLRQAPAEVFEGWITTGTAGFVAAGLSAERARAVTIGMIAALEGAFVLCRASRSTEALDVAGAMAAEMVRGALAERDEPSAI
jgi:AcrR family transcriptional regulator